MTVKSYQKVLGKPHKTLLSHSIDAGFICQYLLTHSVYLKQAEHIAKHTGVSVIQLTDTLSYLCAMHDVGKFHPHFQAKLFEEDPSAKEIIEDLYGGVVTGYRGYRHEVGSKEILLEILKNRGMEGRNSRLLATLLEMHHQGYTKGCMAKKMPKFKDLPKAWESEFITPFVNTINEIFPIGTDILEKISTDMQVWEFSTFIGIIMTCDWIASDCRFAFTDAIDSEDIDSYKMQVFDITEKWIRDADLICRKWDGTYTYKNLFGYDAPRPMQIVVAQAINEHSDFDCVLIEAPTGEGKTEASLYAAMNTMQIRDLQGMYFALPIGLTAKAMRPRLQEMLENIGEDTNVKLSTSTAWLSEFYDETVQQDIIMRKCKFLERFCVGTVDQIMQATELAFYSEMQMVALGAKVVVIDEIHSYDAYMMAIIKAMLRYFKAMGIPVIMLSATLPNKAKDQMMSYYGIQNPKYIDSYPVISVVQDAKLYQYKCEPSGRSAIIKNSVQTGTLDSFYMSAIKQIENGGCLAFVVNSVENAKKAYYEIKKLIKEQGSDIEVHEYLIHAHTTTTEKDEKLDILKELFGPERENRPKRAIVIATPIIEMSVDLDFDFMYRQIAPIDALLQSLGRVARHDDEGTIRAMGITPLFVMMNTPDGNRIYAGVNYRRGDDIPILSVSAEILQNYKKIHLPQDVPALINKVYDDERLADYYKEQHLKEIAGQLNVSDYDAMQVITAGIMEEIGKRKDKFVPTRQINVPYISVAVMDDEQFEIAKSKDLNEVQELYKDTVVSIPSYFLNEGILPRGEEIDGISQWFSDVYIDKGGKVFKLDPEFGLEKMNE